MQTTKQAQQAIEIIMDQLTKAPQSQGMARATAILGASNIRLVQENHAGVDFRFKGCTKFNYCRIMLNGDDFYDLMIGRLITRGRNMGSVRNLGVHIVDADNLAGLFTKITGLDTHL